MPYRFLVLLCLLGVTACGGESSDGYTRLIIQAAPPVPLGGLYRLTVLGTRGDGAIIDVSTEVLWDSSDQATATIDPGGTLRARAIGSTEISATMEDLVGKITITVGEPAVVAIQIPAIAPIAAGLDRDAVAIGTLSDQTTMDITQMATWESLSVGTASIAAPGRIHGVAPGSTTILAKLGSVNNFATVQVTVALLVSLDVTPATVTVPIASTTAFVATGTYTDASTQDLTAQVTWTSSMTAVATIDAAGVATAVAEGTTTITAAMGTTSDTATLTVTP